MKSDNKTVMKALAVLQDRRSNLLTKKEGLYERIEEKYPEDMYGIKGMMVFEQKSKELNDEINLLTHYIKGFYDLMEYVEIDLLHIQERD